jgi:hypothetical protein
MAITASAAATAGAAGKVCWNHQQRIDPCRWMKRSGDIHRKDGQSDRGGSRPCMRPGHVEHCQPDQGRPDMPADQRARLRRLHLRRSDDQHDGSGKRNDDQREVRCEREPLHGADGDRGPKTRNGSRQGIPAIIAADRIGRRPQPVPSHSAHHKRQGRQIALPPPNYSTEISYFRLVTAVRSAESLTMPAAPHQLEPKPPGLMRETFAGLNWLAV